MNPIERSLRQAAADLSALQRRFALVGGLAVSVRAEPRLTRDADLAVAVDGGSDAETLIHDLHARGYEVLATVEQQRTGRLAAARLARSIVPVSSVLDLLFASCGIETEIVDAAEHLTVIAGLQLPVASVGHLIAMKLLARDDRRRPADADDLRALADVATEHDWDEARAAVEKISVRGYDRERDLRSALAALQRRS